jgi:hypothetical protein
MRGKIVAKAPSPVVSTIGTEISLLLCQEGRNNPAITPSIEALVAKIKSAQEEITNALLTNECSENDWKNPPSGGEDVTVAIINSFFDG